MMKTFGTWLKDDTAVAAIEAGLLFPLLMLILCGTIDTGIGLLTSQKTINASHMIADLLTRGSSVTSGEINEAIAAGEMAFEPYNTSSYGADIVGIQYLTSELTPTIMWRRTQNMLPNTDVIDHSEGLGSQDEGIIMVTVEYVYNPIFSDYMVGPIRMKEETFARSRKGTFIASANGATP